VPLVVAMALGSVAGLLLLCGVVRATVYVITGY